jgi:hypothetical protein
MCAGHLESRAVQRAITILIVPVLLIATAGAFLAAEALKLAKPPIRVPRHGFLFATFSPVCGATCPTRAAVVRFTLVSSGRLSIDVIDASGRVVRHLVPEHFARHTQTVRWDGNDDAGKRVADGTYHLRLHLRGRRYDMPNPIVLDTVAPTLHLSLRNRVFSPDGDGHADRVAIAYRSNEQLYGRMIVRRKLVLRSGVTITASAGGTEVWRLLAQKHGKRGIEFWNGRGSNGRRMPPGMYTLTVSGHDLAGNQVSASTTVQLRYVTANAPTHAITAGSRFDLSVGADVPVTVRTTLLCGPAGQVATTKATPSVRGVALTAGSRGGVYEATVGGHGHVVHALIPVRGSPPATTAIVVPPGATAASLQPWLARLAGTRYDALGPLDAGSDELLSGYRTLVVPAEVALPPPPARSAYSQAGGHLVTRIAQLPPSRHACQGAA